MTLEDIEKLCAEATPGPWSVCGDDPDGFPYVKDGTDDCVAYSIDLRDAKFVAASRTLMPKLLAVAKAVELNYRLLQQLGVLEVTRAFDELEKS